MNAIWSEKIPRWVYIVLILAWAAFCYAKALKGGDFDVYLDAARKLMEGENIYAPPFAKGLQYYYSVSFALFLSLFVKIPVFGKFLWLSFSSWCIYRSWRIMEFFLEPDQQLSKRKIQVWRVIVIFMAIRFILYNFLALQLTIFLLWAALEAVYQSYRGKELYAGLILGLAINIKLLPLVVLPYLIFRAHFKAFAMAILAIVTLLFLPALWIGVSENAFLLGEWWQVINPVSPENSLKANKLMHSLAAIMPAYLMDPIDGFTGRRQLTHLAPETVKMAIQIARGLLILSTLYFLRWWPFRSAKSKLHIWWELSYLFLIVPLIFPHQQKYSFWFILPAIGYITLQVLQNKGIPTVIKGIYGLLLLLISPIIGRDILGSHIYDLSQFYKLLSLVTLCLIVFLPFLKPISNQAHS